jgi:hypothetical protein
MIALMHADFDALKLLRPTHEPRATEFVPQMLGLIGRLEDNGLAYRVREGEDGGDVNFAVRKLPGYGKLSGKSLDELRAGERVAMEKFLKKIQEKIDLGIPVCQCCIIGILPEEAKLEQEPGGHMRIVIGYNLKTREILYSDSWGPGHEIREHLVPSDGLILRQSRRFWLKETGALYFEPEAGDTLCILKSTDDWFFACLAQENYLICDQLPGLLSAIKVIL